MTPLLAVALALLALVLAHEETSRALAVEQRYTAELDRLLTAERAWRAGR